MLEQLSIPLFTGAIGYITNWTGVLMLFYPVRHRGVRVPGLHWLVTALPRRVQQVPIFIGGRFGWQGIIPSRAAKMGSIAVDKGISKVGSPSEFYAQLEPDKIAEHILVSSRKDMHELVDRIMEREHPQLWGDLPPSVREAIHARVQRQLPEIVRSVTDEIGENIDQLLDVKLMVIRHIEEDPTLANHIFGSIGERELKFIQNFGLWFGLLMGIPLIFILELAPFWWVLPVGGVMIGYVTNYLAIWMIFEPIEPLRLGPLKIHGLFLRRQDEVSDVYAEIIADKIVTLNNIGRELLEGPMADRTRFMIGKALEPAVDRALGRARSAVRLAVGGREYDAITRSVATEGVDYTMTPMRDPEFNRRQSAAIRKLISGRMREMSYRDFSEMLRTAIKQDEWLLFLHGGVLGLGAGLVHLVMFPPH